MGGVGRKVTVQLVAVLAVALLALCAATPDRSEVILAVKHELSRAKLLESSGKREEAAAKVGAVINQLEEWKASLEAPEVEEAAEEPVEYDAVEFDAKVTYKAEKCPLETEEGDWLKIHYVGKLPDGKVFDSSFHTGSMPVKFQLGSKDVVQAWNRGLVGMCESERRTLTVPPELGYGAKGNKVVPPNTPLTYMVELVSFRKSAANRGKKKSRSEL